VQLLHKIMIQHPAVSVIMSVYNNEQFVAEAMNSILNQSFSDFEFIVVNDCSTDNSEAVIHAFNDERIRLTVNETNIGLTKSLNKAIRLAEGKYIARMDADDISFPERIGKQVAFLEANPSITICGCQVTVVHAPDEPGAFPFTHEHIKVRALEANPFAHPTVMWRREDFIRHDLFYNEAVKYAQDYELWSRALMLVQSANLRDHLFTYRQHSGQIGKSKTVEQDASALMTKLGFLKRLGIDATEQEKELHLAIVGSGLKKHRSVADLKLVEAWFCRILAANEKMQVFNQAELINLWAAKIFKKGLYSYSLPVWRWSLSSVARRSNRITIKDKLAFFVKSLIGKQNR